MEHPPARFVPGVPPAALGGHDVRGVAVALAVLVVVAAGAWVVAKYWRIFLGIVMLVAFALAVKIGFALLRHWLP